MPRRDPSRKTELSLFLVHQFMGSIELMFERVSTPGSRDGSSPINWHLLRLLRCGSPSWIPELDPDFLSSRARTTIKKWVCFICHAGHDKSYELCTHLDSHHRQMSCTFSMNPQLFPRCTICREFPSLSLRILIVLFRHSIWFLP